MAFGLLPPSQTWELHRLEDIHIPADLTCSLAEIPLKERSMRRGSSCPMPWKGPSPDHPVTVGIFLGSVSETVTGKSISFPSVLKFLTCPSPW